MVRKGEWSMREVNGLGTLRAWGFVLARAKCWVGWKHVTCQKLGNDTKIYQDACKDMANAKMLFR